MDSHDGIHIIQKDFHDDYDDLEVGHLFGIIIKKYMRMHFSLLKNRCFQWKWKMYYNKLGKMFRVTIDESMFSMKVKHVFHQVGKYVQGWDAMWNEVQATSQT